MGTITFGQVNLTAGIRFTTSPSATGTFSAGNRITCDTGAWRTSSALLAQRTDVLIDGQQVGGWTPPHYDIPIDKNGGTIQFGVMVRNASGQAYALSPVYAIAALNLMAPSLSSDSTSVATTKAITVTLPADAVAGDIIAREHAATVDLAGATADTYTVQAADVTAGAFTWTVSGLGIGARFFRAQNTRGATESPWSEILALVVVPSAPTVEITTPSSDNTPTARVHLNADHVAGHIISLDADDANDFVTPKQNIEHTISGADVTQTWKDMTFPALADGLWYFGATVRASTALVSPRSNTDSETIATIVTSGAPVIADQPLLFGRNTKSGAAGRMLVNTGGAVDGTGTCTISGNANFTINAATGEIAPTGTRGKANPLPASSTATVTYVNAFGSDSCTVTFTCEDDTYDFKTTAELTAAIEDARPGVNGDASAHTGDYWFKQVENTVCGSDTGIYYISGKTMAGTLVEPNKGVLTVAACDMAATGQITGTGSLHITCRTPGGATFAPQLYCRGSGPLIASNLKFSRKASSATYNGANKGYQIYSGTSATYPAKNQLWVHHNVFGGTAHGTPATEWCRVGWATDCDTFIFEDNYIEGAYAGIKASTNSVVTFRRNAARKLFWDHLFFNGAEGAQVTDPIFRLYETGNTLWDRAVPVYGGQHADPHQSGVQAQVSNPDYNNKPYERIIANNVYDFTLTNTEAYSLSQGIFEAYHRLADGYTRGEIANNLLVTEAPNAVTISASVDTNVFNNTCLTNTNADNNGILAKAWGYVWSGTLSVWTDNIWCNHSAIAGDTSGATETGQVRVNPYVAPEDPTSYESNFEGPFVRVVDASQPGSPTRPTFDITGETAAEVRANAVSVFTGKGASLGKGFTVGFVS